MRTVKEERKLYQVEVKIYDFNVPIKLYVWDYSPGGALRWLQEDEPVKCDRRYKPRIRLAPKGYDRMI